MFATDYLTIMLTTNFGYKNLINIQHVFEIQNTSLHLFEKYVFQTFTKSILYLSIVSCISHSTAPNLQYSTNREQKNTHAVYTVIRTAITGGFVQML